MVIYVPVKHESHATINSDYMQTGLPALVGAAKYIMVVNIHEGTLSVRHGTNFSEQVPRGIGDFAQYLEEIFLVLGLILYSRKGNNFLYWADCMFGRHASDILIQFVEVVKSMHIDQ
jgi:hypothetical protein